MAIGVLFYDDDDVYDNDYPRHDRDDGSVKWVTAAIEYVVGRRIIR